MEIFLEIILLIYIVGVIVVPLMLTKSFRDAGKLLEEAEDTEYDTTDLERSLDDLNKIPRKYVIASIILIGLFWPLVLLNLIIPTRKAVKQPEAEEIFEEWYDKVNRENAARMEIFGEMHDISDEDNEALKEARRKRHIPFEQKDNDND